MDFIFGANHRRYFRIVFFFSLGFFIVYPATATQDNALAPPRYSTLDDFGVNLTTGQVTSSLNTLSIGGDMGLSHSVSQYTNSFYTERGYRGYHDQYAGSSERVGYEGFVFIDGTTELRPHILRISALGDSADFKFIQYGRRTDLPNLNAPYSFEALGDKRQTLTFGADGSSLRWTKPDGTAVIFRTGVGGWAGRFEKIIYPNGFSITVHGNASVTTNTGFQLKYDYIHDTRDLPVNKRGRQFGAGTNVPNASSASWSERNPKHIRGINNAVEYCSPSQKGPCNLNKDWPTATFHWPGGMPRAFFIGDSLLRVENATGGVTEYHYQAHDLALLDPYNSSKGKIDNPNIHLNTRFSPRLVAIKPAQADDITQRYTYKNQFHFSGITFLGAIVYGWITTDLGLIDKASGINGSFTYREGEPTGGPGPYPIRWQGSRLSVSSYQKTPTAIANIHSAIDGSTFFEGNHRNFVTTTQDINGLSTRYHYDNRGNLTRIVYQGGGSDETQQRASYPTSCSNPKTCNQPLWVEDAKGNRTNFTYHLASGQVATVTAPANEQGLRAQTRYSYQQRYAYTKNASGNRVRAATPIWMKVSEASCINSNSCSGGSDEVVTRYEYNHDNLLLTGMTVTASGQTLRTCYTYDIYGHRIGETQPNANRTSCN